MNMPTSPMKLGTYLDQHFVCDCGREHYAALKSVRIGENALEALPDLASEMGFQSLYLICDPITYEIAGKKCETLLSKAKLKYKTVRLAHTGFDEATVGELLIEMPTDCDLAVAVGTGAINDMARFFSFKTGCPFFTVATAAPMDGFASSIAAIQVNHLKTTFEAQTPSAIIGDTEILKNAPYRMIAAGLGDLLGKFTCLCDWKLSRIINGEHYCPHIAELVESCVENVLADANKAKDRDPEILGKIMEGLVLAGVAMSLYGNSRPASGCEHHMSHYWEMLFEQAGKRPAPHGAQVGVGTVLILKLVEKLRETSVDFAAARAAAAGYDPAAWESAVCKAYGSAAEGVIALEHEAQKNEPSARLRRIDAMEKHWEEILELLAGLPSSQEIVALLRSLDSPCLPSEIGVDNNLLRQTFLYCNEVRARYTILQMAWDLGLLDTLSDRVIGEL
ncbi:MAG: sn-glycerol-1-phosphate dehydrogenase [Oscillibacter sp.]|nr:sn-glycerol-1-phosphate dehydrogenase [Oscillibacter sp.]MEA4994223.1 sn-glycerol-1-phosphate dehydrogenase [Oscillibacter sp.]